MSTTAVVLIVEKNREVREALRERLRGPCRVLEAADLQVPRATLEEPAPRPDLILSDLRGTDRQGLALSRRLRADPHLEATPVLLLVPPAGTEETTEANGDTEPLHPASVGPQVLRRLVGHHLAAEGLSPGPPLVPDASLPEAVGTVVEARLGDPTFTVGQLAAAVDLSRRQLTRRMKAAMGRTPAEYIRTRRVNRAQDLLAEVPRTIAEVARAVGFASPSAFSKAFREAVGCSPSTYAERHGG